VGEEGEGAEEKKGEGNGEMEGGRRRRHGTREEEEEEELVFMEERTRGRGCF
jgi:hypothetical protein